VMLRLSHQNKTGRILMCN